MKVEERPFSHAKGGLDSQVQVQVQVRIRTEEDGKRATLPVELVLSEQAHGPVRH